MTFETYLEKLSQGLGTPIPSQINTDSRTIGPGQWFLPIRGENFDGHKFIQQALTRGAAGFFYERGESVPTGGIELPCSGLEALQKIARSWRNHLKGKVTLVGITGSNGKTTVKEMLRSMLPGRVLATSGSLNNEIGLPLTLCQLSKDHDYAILEMGARHVGDIGFLSAICDQDFSVLTNIGRAHLGEFGSLENLTNTKCEIFQTPSHLKGAILPPKYLDRLPDDVEKVFTFGGGPNADVSVQQSSMKDHRLEVVLDTPAGEFTILAQVPHVTTPENLACCVALGLNLDLSKQQIISGLETFSGFPGRFQIHALDSYTLIDDAYNANEQSMAAGLDSLGMFFSGQKLTLVLGDMLELGEDEISAHESIGRKVAQLPAAEIILYTVGERSQRMAEAARSAGLEEVHWYRTAAELEQVFQPTPGRVLYIKSSHGVGLHRLCSQLLKQQV